MIKNLRKSILVIGIILITFLVGIKSSRAATWTVINGDFESGPGVGWFEGCDFGDCEGWVIIKNTMWAASGNWLASLDPGDSILQIGLPLPADAYKITFSFDYKFWDLYDKDAAVGIFDSGTNEMLAVKTTADGGMKYNDLKYSKSYIDLTSHKGKNIDIFFYSEDSLDVDNVRIDVYFGSVKINNDATYTRSATVTLNLSAVSGTEYMRFSNDSSHWTGWTPYTKTYSWSLTNSIYGGTSSEGTKRVYILFQDQYGNICPVTSDTIIYDKTKPTGSININKGAVYAYSRYVTLYPRASDNLSGVKYMRFSNNGAKWSSWKPYSLSYTWSITESTYGGNGYEGTKYVYVQFKDKAGNISTTISDWIIYNPRKVRAITVYKFHYNAKGDDRYNLNDEYVILKNNLRGPIVMKKWFIKDASGHKYIFPTFTLKSGAYVTIHTGKGTNTSTHLYMKYSVPIWNNDHDTLYLYTRDSKLILKYSY